ncbi:MAG: diguanylate cyclase domain-containing protein [Vulcanimicrobiaceae bacterium]
MAAMLLMVALRIPGAFYAIDPGGHMTLTQAERAAYRPASSFEFPGTASTLHPLILWVRFAPADTTERFLVASPSVGTATLFFSSQHQPGAVQERTFGMRVPFAQRDIPRVPPTLAIPPSVTHAPMYLRLSLDDEALVEPVVTLMNRKQLGQQDALLARLSSEALLFIGIFLSLAAANVFVYFFVRERSYIIYSGMMLSNALFASTYMHESAWRWFWPMLSLPDTLVQATVTVLAAAFLLAFARAFLKTARTIPRIDRVAVWLCSVFMTLAIASAIFFPSYHFTQTFTGREFFLVLVVAYVAVVFGLALASMRAGSLDARFFVVSNGLVSLTAAWVAISNMSAHSPSATTNFVALMTGQAVEGWLLFGALAYRLRRTMGAHMDEQQRRFVAQAELITKTQALLHTQELASTDALTGIANRRVFDESLEREWSRCARSGASLCLLMLDVDHFKRYNDTYGHVAGDKCLRRIAGAIASCTRRPTDLCARYGGEEFAVLIADMDSDGGRELGESIVRAIRSLQIPHVASPSQIVSVSIGIAAAIPDAERDAATLVSTA